MMTEKEQQCVEALREIQLSRIREKIKNEGFFKKVVSECPFWEGPDEDGAKTKERLIFFLVTPLLFLLGICYMTLSFPFYILKVLADLRQLERLRTAPLPTESPERKTLRALWDLYANGDKSRGYYSCAYDDRMVLIERWVEILYGPRVLSGLDLDDRLKKLIKARVDANRNKAGIHYTFASPVESVLYQLSGELPPYE